MPPHLIEREPRKWKKNEWKALSPGLIMVIMVCHRLKINKIRPIPEELGIDPIYPSDNVRPDGRNLLLIQRFPEAETPG
jgi:hypothetical protein